MVTSFTQLLEKQYNDRLDDNAKEYIQYAVDGSKRMFELLNGLLAYSRVQTKGSAFELISMETVIHKVQENLKLIINEKSAIITVETTMPQVNADENQMVQLIQNLVENSIKFCKEAPKVIISCGLENGKYVFSLEDNGIGIDPQYYDRIFRIFQRLHLRNEYLGIGIGLSICKRIVERHGGNIWVDSIVGKGSTFKFSIPITPIQ
jgi:light-regulated signal transduction histidine kinase (bacteriophytochrome)